MDAFLRDATDVHRRDLARARLADVPRTFAVALVTGDVDAVRAALDADPAAATTPVAGRLPLIWVTHSGFLADAEDEPRLVPCARLLLDAGADPDTTWTHPEFGALSALYGAAGVAFSVPMTELLLATGATPDDGESVYHACETRDHTILRMLLAAGATVRGTNAIAHMLDHDDLDGLRLLLDAAAAQGGYPLDGIVRFALTRDRSRAHVELLLAAGANPQPGDAELAVRLGRTDLAGLLGPAAPSPADALVGALRTADRAAVDAVIAAHPGVVASLGRHDHAALVHAAARGDLDALALALELGFPATVRSDEAQGTALHAAAWYGRTAIVDLLLEAGADPHADAGPPFGGTALDWALRGSRYAALNHVGTRDGIDHAATARRLLDEGARFRGDSAGDATAEVAALLP